MAMSKALMMGAVAGLVALSPASPAAAAETAVPKAATAHPAAHDATDFSAVRRRYYRRGPHGAALAIMGAATGLIAGAIVEQRRRLLRGALLLRPASVLRRPRLLRRRSLLW